MGSTSAASSQVMGGGIKPGMGVSLETPPLQEDVEVTGPVAAKIWVAGSTGAGGERLAAGLAPRARPRVEPALPSLSSASAPALSDAGRDRRGAGRDLADLDGVPQGSPHPARRPAARRRRQPVLHALSRRL